MHVAGLQEINLFSSYARVYYKFLCTKVEKYLICTKIQPLLLLTEINADMKYVEYLRRDSSCQVHEHFTNFISEELSSI